MRFSHIGTAGMRQTEDIWEAGSGALRSSWLKVWLEERLLLAHSSVSCAWAYASWDNAKA